MGAAVKASDVVLIPVRPSPADLWAVGDLVEVVRARQEITEGSPPAAFVVSSAIVGTNLSGQVAEALEGYEIPTLEGRTCQRIIYAESMITGSTVLDEDKGGKAAGEIEAIRRDMLDLLTSTH